MSTAPRDNQSQAERVARARTHASGLVARLGVPQAARELGLSPDALARIIAGLPGRAGTVALVLEHEHASR